jgi:urease accessory protein
MKQITMLSILILLTLPKLAFAHGVSGNGFYAGLLHPVGGLDHLLAMLSVGILSTQMGGKYIWTIPATFVSVMLLGGIAGFEGIDIASIYIEHSIMLSVILLGLVIATGSHLTVILIYLFVAFFGFSHGYAHGVEMPIQANPFYFAAGFVLSTIVIHIIGVIIGFIYASGKQQGAILLQYTGAIVMGMGLHMLLSYYMG